MSILAVVVVAFGAFFLNALLEDLQWRRDKKAGLTKEQSRKKAIQEEYPDYW